VGVSNFTPRNLHELAALAEPSEIACNQVLYHLAEWAIEHQVIPQCDKLGTAVVAYSPFGVPPRFRISDPIRSGPERRGINARTAQEVHA
jgi:diketogulonate reductase-like aldo/keto reductase